MGIKFSRMCEQKTQFSSIIKENLFGSNIGVYRLSDRAVPMQKIEARIPNSSFRIFATTFEVHSYVVTGRLTIERIVLQSSEETKYNT
jgi:hypothetical protein